MLCAPLRVREAGGGRALVATYVPHRQFLMLLIDLFLFARIYAVRMINYSLLRRTLQWTGCCMAVTFSRREGGRSHEC